MATPNAAPCGLNQPVAIRTYILQRRSLRVREEPSLRGHTADQWQKQYLTQIWITFRFFYL